MTRLPLVYILHSGNLYGTERMALATADGLRDQFDTTFFAPPGPVLGEANRLGFHTIAFSNPRELLGQLKPFWSNNRRLAVMATGVVQSFWASLWNLVYQRDLIHLHLVHGGTDERDSYGRKRWLNYTGVIFVAVSEFVKERLIAHGVRPSRIVVIENFLLEGYHDVCPRRGPFERSGVKKIIVISRIDPIKRVDLLLDALDREPGLSSLEIRILGSGWDLEVLRTRACCNNRNVTFEGFHPDVPGELVKADLLVHLCPVEPFGLTILESMAAGVPVLVPDSGGAGAIVEDGVTGFRFRSNQSDALAICLLKLKKTPSLLLNRVVEGGRQALRTRFSPPARLSDYRCLLEGRSS